MGDNDESAELEALARVAADKVLYINHAVYGYIPATLDIENRSWGSVANAYSEMGTMTLGNLVTDRSLKIKDEAEKFARIQGAITDATGFHSFSLVSQGNSAIVLLGRSDTALSILRVCAHPEAAKQRKSIDRINESVRSAFPGLLQSRQDPISIDDLMQIEILPPVQYIRLEDEERLLAARTFEDIAKDTCYEVNINELAVLPDGTLVIVDPGECHYKPEFWQLNSQGQEDVIAESQDQIDQNSWDLHVPEQFVWVEHDGSLKQNRFFPRFDAQGEEPGLDMPAP